MKYPTLKSEKKKALQIGPLNKGVDLSNAPLYINGGCISDCKNLIFSDGVLKTRAGITADNQNILKSDYTDDAFFNSYRISDSEFFIGGEYFRIVTETSELDITEYCTSIYLLNRDRQLTPVGCIKFTDSETTYSYMPSRFTFFQGKPQSGCGLFAFVTKIDTETYSQSLYEIYELNPDMTKWKKCTGFYIPTVYINGRGDMYEVAKDNNFANMEAPLILESPNMLTGKFYAYFSSDGYSSNFSLPFTKLSDEKVSCRIYYSPSSYVDWNIAAGSTSAVKEFMGVKVTMSVDRSKGLIFFSAESGDYAVPLMSKYKANNIRVTASKTGENAFSDVVSSDCCLITDSRIILSGGNKSNRIYTANYDNPLYFPLNEVAAVGESNLPVTTLVAQSGKIIAFKKNSVYRVTLKKGKAKNTQSLLADNDSVFYKTDSFTIECISNTIGCPRREAVTLFHGKAVWIGSDANIYALTSLSSIKHISGKIHRFLADFPDYSIQESVALNNGEYCYFFIYNTGLAVKLDKENLSDENSEWYIWDFPVELQIAGGISNDISPVLMCLNNYSTCYFAVFGGERDILPDRLSAMPDERKISCRFATAYYAPDGINARKRLDRIHLQFESKGETLLKINGKEAAFTKSPIRQSNNTKYIFFAGLKDFDCFYISLESDEYLSFSHGEIRYAQSGN